MRVCLYLKVVYMHQEVFDVGFYSGDDGGISITSVGAKIQECANGKGGHAAFASTFWL